MKAKSIKHQPELVSQSYHQGWEKSVQNFDLFTREWNTAMSKRKVKRK